MTNINKLYYEENRDKIKERAKNYYYSNRDDILINRAKYYESNKGKILDKSNNKKILDRSNNYFKLYYEENKDKIKERAKKDYYLNRDDRLIDRAKYYESNKEKILNRSNNYFKSYYEANKEKIIKHSVNYVKELKKTMTPEERLIRSEREKQYRIKANNKKIKETNIEPIILKISPIIDFDD